jgi:hypothetical protein
VTYRLAYGFLVILLLALLAIMLDLRSVPFWQNRLHYAPVAVDVKNFSVTWANARGELADTTSLPVNERETFQFEFPYVSTHEPVMDSALKVVVKEKLPDTGAYVMRIIGKDGSVMLPLRRQDDGTYASSEFIPASQDDAAKYVHGVRVVHLHGEEYSMAVERVLP